MDAPKETNDPQREWTWLPIQDCLPSTNTWLKEHAACCLNRSVLLAREQSGGRGRNERPFYSAKDKGLYLSVLLKESFSPQQQMKLTALCALALQRAVWECCRLSCSIKWVNDLYYKRYKLAGILCETLYQGQTGNICVIGFGVNIYEQSFPQMNGNHPASLADFCQTPPTPLQLARVLLEHLGQCLRHIDDPAWMDAYRACSCVIGQQVEIRQGARTFLAYVKDIDEQGQLIIHANGKQTTLCSGEISLRLSDMPGTLTY